MFFQFLQEKVDYLHILQYHGKGKFHFKGEENDKIYNENESKVIKLKQDVKGEV